MKENSADDTVRKNPDPEGSGQPGTGPASPAVHEKRIVSNKRSGPQLVQRATALRGQSIAMRPPEPKSVRRRRTQMDLYAKDAEIPYMKFESAVRDLVCSLMERQDRMNEEIFYHLNDLRFRTEDLEAERQAAGDSS
jgi:hypothetical protein